MIDTRKFVEDYLSHEYDPVKAKAYYERTKKLKGRTKGAGVAPAVDSYGNPHPSTIKKPPTKTAAPSDQAKRVDALKGRLDRLNEVLDLMQSKVAAAQARSGVESTSKKAAEPAKKAASSNEASKDKTSSEKKDDAKAAKERYEKNKDPETAAGAQAVQDEIEAVQKQIADARAALTAALEKARASSPKPKTAKAKPSKSSKEGDRQNGA